MEIDDVITQCTRRHLRKKYSLTPIVTNVRWYKMCEKDVVGIVKYTEIFHVNSKITQTTQAIC